MKGLDGFLERDRDRALFDLPDRPKPASKRIFQFRRPAEPDSPELTE